MRLTRSMISTAIALFIGISIPLAVSQPANAACGTVNSASSYWGWDGTWSTHVVGTNCSTRYGRLVWDTSDSCCNPWWVKIERQLWGSYGWLTTHTQSKRVEFGNFGTHNTGTVPSRPSEGSERFHACWGIGYQSNPPSSWTCGGWVS
ncbi:hypothetical protein IL992_26610 [Microbispora sp. NEAU-D428]|uniref:hypothetical protein n=1 Tax=Microbispora sitophila TaxID=2771537 RepID=UPI001868DA07|nr:hypothetical protein [Microbispora sitophila]MBE3012733.1 hypothetical protein [Microbispora sitophila]